MTKKITVILLLLFLPLNTPNVMYSMENPSLKDEGIAGWLQFVDVANLASQPTTLHGTRHTNDHVSQLLSKATSTRLTAITILNAPAEQSTINNVFNKIQKKPGRHRIHTAKVKVGRPKKASFIEASDPNYKNE